MYFELIEDQKERKTLLVAGVVHMIKIEGRRGKIHISLSRIG